ncbi:MAG: AI-2E family transporter [candidate division WOR-3 bacterium]
MDRIFIYIAVVILVSFFVISKIFSPLWLLLLVVFILWPYRKNGEVRPLFLISMFILCAYIIIRYFPILVPFIIGTGIAYIIGPLVDLLEKKRLPRTPAILIILVPLVAVIPLILFLLTVNLVNELKFLVAKIPEFVDCSKLLIDTVSQRLNAVGIYLDQEVILNTVTNYLGTILSSIMQTIGQVGQGVRGVILLVYNLILIPVIAYIFLADRERITLWFKNLLHGDEQEKFSSFIERLNISFARYFRGQFILMVVVGFIIGFMLWLLGVRYYVFLGIVAGICNLIPNVGFVFSLIVAILLGLFTPPPLVTILKILVVYLGEQLLENFFLGPVIIGRAARLNPAVVLLALILGGAIAGFWGLVLAVPVIIFLREFLNHFFGVKL